MKKFQTLVRKLAEVNDASKRTVMLVQESVFQTLNERKTTKMLLVKSTVLRNRSQEPKKLQGNCKPAIIAAEQLD